MRLGRPSREQEPYGARSIRFAKGSAMKVLTATAVQLSPVLYSRRGTVENVVEQLMMTHCRFGP
jgi:hypothetical protein